MAEKPVAIVTAAGRGIGEAVARELHARGYELALMSPSGSSKQLAVELGGFGLNGSVTEPDDLRQLVESTHERFGRIDAVVNNSGRHAEVLKQYFNAFPEMTGTRLSFDPDFAPDILSIPDEAWLGDYELLVLNVIRMARLVTPYMEKAGHGAIVNISGMEALEPRQIYPLGANRLTLHGFTKLYADRYGRAGIRMNCVLPGMIENADEGQPGIAEVVPLGRYGGLDEIAKTAAFLLSEDAGYITGQMILVDGGLNRSAT